MIKINLNKKPKKLRIKIEKKSIKSMSGFVLIPIIAGAVVAAAMNYTITAKINATIKNIKVYNGEISALLPKVQKVNAIKKKQADILQKINIIKTLKKEQSGPIGYMYYITMALPRFAWIDSLKSAGGNISVNGIALDGQVVSLFMDNLNKTGYFNNVTLLQTSEVKKQELKLQNFNLTFNANYKQGIKNAVNNK
ncbi:MAG: PilN domain-containing protein [Deltaproteobacteria bacterium]|jgi:type IV pilus assembly protein PilN|nr:PilN domain-containing protein [Deltaproteobacteria bacterium]MCL5880334.1 PilN domain-containing protein [Deltaproteobacteria bacterium]MDA8303627.1 PilN domain-containing protein [Deltaproteobacteria bacterium]